MLVECGVVSVLKGHNVYNPRIYPGAGGHNKKHQAPTGRNKEDSHAPLGR